MASRRCSSVCSTNSRLGSVSESRDIGIRLRLVPWNDNRFIAHADDLFEVLDSVSMTVECCLGLSGRTLDRVLDIPESDWKLTLTGPPPDQGKKGEQPDECSGPFDMKEEGPIQCDIGQLRIVWRSGDDAGGEGCSEGNAAGQSAIGTFIHLAKSDGRPDAPR